MSGLTRYLAGHLTDAFRERVSEDEFRDAGIARVLVAPGLDESGLETVGRMFPGAEVRVLSARAGVREARRARPQVAIIPMCGGSRRPRVACLLSGARHKLLMPSPDYVYRLGIRRGRAAAAWAAIDRLVVAPFGLLWLGLVAASLWARGLTGRAVHAETDDHPPGSVVAVRLVPPGTFAGLLRRLQERWPGVRVAAVIAAPEGMDMIAGRAEVICVWGRSRAEARGWIRRMRPHLVILAGGADYGLGATYWKAVLLALLSGARVRRQWEVGDRLPGRPLGRAVAGAFARVVTRGLAGAARFSMGWILRQRFRREYRRPPRRGPKLVQIGLTEACNYHCVMCPFHNPAVDGEHKESELPRISYQAYASLLADLKRMGTRSVDICGNGEPLTHPEGMEMIALAREMGFDVSLASNGFLLTEARLRRLVDLGIRRLHVSLNAGTSETYARTHPGTPAGTFETIIGRLREMADYADATARRRIEVEYSVVLTRLNMGEVVQMVRAAHRARAEWLVVILMGPVTGQPDLVPRPEDWPQIREQIAAAGKLAKELGIETNFEELQTTATAAGTRTVYEHIPCYIGHEFALVVGGGSVIFCCHCSRALGDLNKERFPAIWKSEMYQEERARAMALPETRQPVPECGCFHACSHVGKNVEIHARLHGKGSLRWMR